ncbi:MAG: hypothetical protein VB031_04740 [Eubacteriaceae bacterium]|nr:hypothetical protein [Eubacteriaceae bacterium]
MKSSIKKSTFKAIYRLLDRVSPIEGDCGRMCGAACCTPEGDETSPDAGDFELGIYLLPGEEKLFTRRESWLKWTYENAEDYDFPDSWHGKVFFIRCTSPPHCKRDMRPLQCRTYPLAPHLDLDGNFSLVLSTAETPYECPLISESISLDPRFIKATFTVWKRLIKDPLIYDLVKLDSELRLHHPV